MLFRSWDAGAHPVNYLHHPVMLLSHFNQALLEHVLSHCSSMPLSHFQLHGLGRRSLLSPRAQFSPLWPSPQAEAGQVLTSLKIDRASSNASILSSFRLCSRASSHSQSHVIVFQFGLRMVVVSGLFVLVYSRAPLFFCTVVFFLA